MEAEYSAREIVVMLEQRNLQGHEIAEIIAAFYPTIKAALLLYDETTGGKRVAPIPSTD